MDLYFFWATVTTKHVKFNLWPVQGTESKRPFYSIVLKNRLFICYLCLLFILYATKAAPWTNSSWKFFDPPGVVLKMDRQVVEHGEMIFAMLQVLMFLESTMTIFDAISCISKPSCHVQSFLIFCFPLF